MEKVSVKAICERDGVFSTCPSARLIRTGHVLHGRKVKPPFHQRANRIEGPLRLSVTIELKKCDEIVAQADLLSGG